MTGFLTELGTKLADRWLTLLVLPGALLAAAAAIAGALGQAHALDFVFLRARISALAAAPGSHSAGVLLLAAGGILAASTLAGLTAAALGSMVSRLWTAAGLADSPGTNRLLTWLRCCRPAYWLTVGRSRSWHDKDRQLSALLAVAEPLRNRAALIEAGITAPAGPLPDPVSVPGGTGSQPPSGDSLTHSEILAASRTATREADAALARRDRIARHEPSGPTWIGDRFRDAQIRIVSAYDLDITIAWPRLWAVLPDNLRTDLSAALDAYTASARLIGWAALYFIVGAWWWPSLVIAAVTGVTGWIRGRAGTAVLADLVETAVDLHGRTLATQLGITCDGPLDRDAGFQVTQRLRKGNC